MKIRLIQKNKGFTLIEMLVAVFIFSVALAGLMTISSRGLKAARLAQNQVVANYLALEGIEVVRNMRDSGFVSNSISSTWENIFNQNECLNFLENESEGYCIFQFSDQNFDLFPCSGSNCSTLFYNSNIGYYRNFESGVPDPGFRETGFDRQIYLEQPSDNPDEIIVRVNVSWETGSVEYVENLFLWF